MSARADERICAHLSGLTCWRDATINSMVIVDLRARGDEDEEHSPPFGEEVCNELNQPY